jgi:hypothetical protein|tara:strand:+ start:10 stop:825 length:816 start_codon:yes stop_codon:yes gene_type:complete
MATLNLGRIKPVFRGAYNGATAYVVDDIVTSGGSSYICILASTGNAVSNATYWTQMAAGGTDVGTTITTQGDILYRDGSGLQRLAKGTSAQTLKMNSGATAPEWVTVTTPPGGLDVSDVWRVHTGANMDSAGTDLTSNWERADDVGQGSLGTGMTESSGVFTFPSTGFWTILWKFSMSHGGGVQSRYAGGRGYVSVDGGSTFTEVLTTTGSIPQNYSTTWSNNFTAFAQLDVTDTSNFQVKFQVFAENSGDFHGSTQKNANCVWWQKVGAT